MSYMENGQNAFNIVKHAHKRCTWTIGAPLASSLFHLPAHRPKQTSELQRLINNTRLQPSTQKKVIAFSLTSREKSRRFGSLLIDNPQKHTPTRFPKLNQIKKARKWNLILSEESHCGSNTLKTCTKFLDPVQYRRQTFLNRLNTMQATKIMHVRSGKSSGVCFTPTMIAKWLPWFSEFSLPIDMQFSLGALHIALKFKGIWVKPDIECCRCWPPKTS